jgi:ABC-type lipoprotein release transport system permease subunit
MLLYIKLAWRNIFRNKRRTIISGLAIAIGLASLIYVDALYIGMKNNIVDNITKSFMSDGQIHRKGFRQRQEVELTINNIDDVIKNLKKEEIVNRFSVRAYGFSMISSSNNVGSVILVGIDPDKERYISQMDDAIIKGDYFKGEKGNQIIIGKKLAEILEVELGDRIVVTVAQANSSELSQELFRVSGIYFLNNPQFDKGMAFIKLGKARKMLNIGTGGHEIAIKLKKGIDRIHIEKLSIWKKYSSKGNEAISWIGIMPQMKMMFEMTNLSLSLIGFILFAIVALVIINSLFMSIYERMFELGVLRAIGTRPSGAFKMIIFESGALAVFSIILGIVLGYLITLVFTKIGIDYTGIEMMGITIKNIIYPVIELRQFIIYPIIVFFITILVGIYPGIYAAKLQPAEALRKSL